MRVELESITKSVRHPEFSPEALIVYKARISNPGNQLNRLTDGKLIEYMITHNHWSPFEMVHLSFYIETSRLVSHQMIRHWSFRFQEFSQRYAEVEHFAKLPSVIRKQGTANRQGSGEVFTRDEPDVLSYPETIMDYVFNEAERGYKELLQLGVAREQARMVLPEATPTTLYVAGPVRSFIHYFDVRTAPDAQGEHAELARSMLAIFREHFPLVSAALDKRAFRREREKLHHEQMQAIELELANARRKLAELHAEIESLRGGAPTVEQTLQLDLPFASVFLRDDRRPSGAE